MTPRRARLSICAVVAVWGLAVIQAPPAGGSVDDRVAASGYAARTAVVWPRGAGGPSGPGGARVARASAAPNRASGSRAKRKRRTCRQAKRRRPARRSDAGAAATRKRATAKAKRGAAKRRRPCRRRKATRRPVARVPAQTPATTPVAGVPTQPTEPGVPVPPVPLSRYVSVQAREFYFSLSRPVVATGSVTIELRNNGEDPHNLVVSPEGTHDSLLTFADHDPSDVSTQQLTLPLGRYYLWCSLEGHEAAGMKATLRVE